MVKPNTVSNVFTDVFAVRRVEFETFQRCSDFLLLFFRAVVGAHQILRHFGAFALGEIHNIYRRLIGTYEIVKRFVNGLVAVGKIKRYGSLC